MDSIGIQVASQNQTVDDHFHNSNGRKGAWLWPTPTQDWYRRSIMWNFFGMGLVTGCYKDSLDGWISKTTANLVLTPRLQELWPMDTNCFLSPPRTRGLFRLILIRCHFFAPSWFLGTLGKAILQVPEDIKTTPMGTTTTTTTTTSSTSSTTSKNYIFRNNFHKSVLLVLLPLSKWCLKSCTPYHTLVIHHLRPHKMASDVGPGTFRPVKQHRPITSTSHV